MNFLQGIAILLIFCALPTSSSPPPRRRLPELTQVNTVLGFNLIREGFGEFFEIANMHELTYDSDLETEALKMESCDDKKHGPNYRAILCTNTFLGSEQEWTDAEIDARRERKLDLNMTLLLSGQTLEQYKADKMKTPFFQEVLNALQTKIGCVYLVKMCPTHVTFNGSAFEGKGEKYIAVCLLGPLGTGFGGNKTGPLGSQCPGEKTKYGLCKESPLIVTKAPADQIKKEESKSSEDLSSSSGIIFAKLVIFFCIVFITMKI